MKLIKLFKEDLNTPKDEIKKNLYHWHFYGGFVLTLILTILFSVYAGMPHVQPYIFSIAVNFLLWLTKEMIWYTAFTFEKQLPWLSKFRKYKVFQWGKPDYKDVRFSFYGSIPFIMLLRLFKKS
jgi:hypothetical protein